jgi:predicted lactoylglutathione lyase
MSEPPTTRIPRSAADARSGLAPGNRITRYVRRAGDIGAGHGAAFELDFLGVADLRRSRRFYEQGLGWAPSVATREGIAYYQAGGVILALFDDVSLTKDIGVGSAFRSALLAHNVRSREQVDAVLAQAEDAGGRIVKRSAEAPWGGYAGTFADPDSHLWEIAWNPHFSLSDDGSVRLSAGGRL